MKTLFGNGIDDQYTQTDSLAFPTSTFTEPNKKSRTTITRPLQLLIVACMIALSGFDWIPFDIMKGVKTNHDVANILDTGTFKGGTKHHPMGKKVQLPLSQLTQSRITNCQSFFSPTLDKMIPRKWIENIERPLSKEKRIPSIIHQTSQSRCVHEQLFNLTVPWRQMEPLSYYFHDDDAIWRLLGQNWPEFPLLHHIIPCMNSMTAVSDIWRYLVLWEYGGKYSDLDSISANFTWSSISDDEDAYFILEYYEIPSQYWMAVPPRHPIMYYAIHHAITNVMASPEMGTMDASHVVGPHALLSAMKWLLHEMGQAISGPPMAGGLYMIRFNRTIRLVGTKDTCDAVIIREGIDRGTKIDIYKHVQNMTHFLVVKSDTTRQLNQTCMTLISDTLVGVPKGMMSAASPMNFSSISDRQSSF